MPRRMTGMKNNLAVNQVKLPVFVNNEVGQLHGLHRRVAFDQITGQPARQRP